MALNDLSDAQQDACAAIQSTVESLINAGSSACDILGALEVVRKDLFDRVIWVVNSEGRSLTILDDAKQHRDELETE